MNNRNKILLGAGGFFALWLLTRRKKNLIDDSDLGEWSKDRFDTFDYYNEETQESLVEQEKKNSPSYFGDKSEDAIYDPFYDYSDSQDQLYVIQNNENGLANYEPAQAFRIRIVPNSLRFCGELETIQSGELGDPTKYSAKYYLSCILEIFNPYKFTSTEYNQATINDIYITDVSLNGVKYNPNAFTSDSREWHSLRDGQGGLIKYLNTENYFNMTDASGKVITVKNAILGEHSLFIPEVFSYTPYLGKSLPFPLFRSDNFAYKISSDKTSYKLDESWLKDVKFCVHFKLSNSSSRKNWCEIKVGTSNDTATKYTADSNTSVSTQKESYFKINTSTPIYRRKEVCGHLLPYKTLPSIDKVDNGYIESINLLDDVQEYRDFGTLDPWKLLY